MTTKTTSAVEERISQVIGGINNLPTPPVVFTQIQKVVNNPNTSAYDIASILQEDPAISAKVLKLTNSAFYGIPRAVESVKQAVVIIGLESVKNLVLSASVFDAFSKEQINAEFQESFWRHSLATAFAARLLAHRLRAKQSFDSERGFSAGLLHDIGKMVISVYMPNESREILKLKKADPQKPDFEHEEMVLGYNHAQIGALLGEKWALPEALVEAVKFHHFPELSDNPQNSLPHLTHFGNYLAKITFDVDPENGDESHIPLINDPVTRLTGVTGTDLHKFSPVLREEFFKSETFMELAKG
jgi:putative nucleotidyltransferase with HDIG domain